jgi:hypothetical protein
MANIFMMNEEIARGMVCFFHQKKHFYLIISVLAPKVELTPVGRRLEFVGSDIESRLGLLLLKEWYHLASLLLSQK